METIITYGFVWLVPIVAATLDYYLSRTPVVAEKYQPTGRAAGDVGGVL